MVALASGFARSPALAFAIAAFVPPPDLASARSFCDASSRAHPNPAFLAERCAFGAPLRGGCAAFPSRLLLQQFCLQQLPMLSPLVTLTLLLSLMPLPKKFPGASLRDRATLPSPLRGLVPSGGYPSRLRSLRSLRGPLARRFASLTAACLPAAVVGCAGAPAVPPLPPHHAGAARPARFGAAARPLTRRGGSPSVPVPEPFSPSLMSSAWVCPTARGRLRSHTPRSGLPRPPPPTSRYARLAFQLHSGTPEHSRFRSMACRKKFRQSDRTARTDLTERASR